MSSTRPLPRLAAIFTALVALVVSACSAGATPSPAASTAASAGASGGPSGGPSGAASPAPTLVGAPVKLTIGLGYIPSIQFAPFYLAQQEGLYTRAGLDVTFQNGSDQDLIPLTGAGRIDISLSDGTSVVPAVSQGIPIQYVATIYGQFPSILFAKTSAGIRTPADLKGKKLGTPGRYGSSWVMLQAMLDSVGLKPTDLSIVEYPDYGQGTAVAKGAVDVATGFANNEPVQLRLAGEDVSVLKVDTILPLPGPGMVAGKAALDDTNRRAALKAFVGATLQAMSEIIAAPAKGVDASIKAVPDLASSRATQEAILAATIQVWRSPLLDSKGLGTIDTEGWSKTIDYLGKLGLVSKPITVSDATRTDLLP